MCVGVAKRCKVKGKDQWVLAKIRDRNYSPEYELDVVDSNGIETLFMTDQNNGWNEGVNSKGIMIISMALDNHNDSDIYDTKVRSTPSQIMKKNKKANETLVEAMQQSSIKNSIKILKDKINYIRDLY